jgi:pimeloyl-ACP methyl ester carboxylesterase
VGPVFLASPSRGALGLETALKDRAECVTTTAFPGYERLFVDPNDNEAPLGLFDEAADWLAALTEPCAPRPPPDLGPLLAERALEGPGWREEALVFGDGLAGALAWPAAPAPGRPLEAVVFLNTGGDPKAGIGRFAVAAARRLAAEGRIALRFDFAGVGDSPAPAGLPSIHVYETPRSADFDAVHALLTAKGCARIRLVGVSAGGFHALWRVLEDPRFFAAFCISTIKLVWRSGDALTIGARRWGRSTGAYLGDMLSPAAWRRLVSGQVAVGPISRSVAARMAAALKPERFTSASRAFRRRVKGVSERGGRIGLLMGLEDAALDEVEAHFGRGGRSFRRLPGMSITVIEGLDHGLVYAQSRAAAFEALQRWLAAA